ncbi:MAG: T9SS type A sorting domain-containing protein [Calditrichaeota bacterium]|nr:T9SS type A sorting domain-containing protein [Calditrichota bacterium]
MFASGNQTSARPVTRVEIFRASENWLQEIPEFWQFGKTGMAGYSINYKKQMIPILDESTGRILAYVVSLSPKGFLILSADNRLNPILGFSGESNYWPGEDSRNVLLQIVRSDISHRLDFIEKQESSADVINQNKRKWRELLGDQDRSQNRILGMSEIYGPYVTSKWGQGRVNGDDVFNLYTPNHWPAGCVATALAQILYYYRWPLTGTGKHLYNEDDAGTLSADFSRTRYDWKNMLPDYQTAGASLVQRRAAGWLTFQCAVSVDMDFEETGSTASTRNVASALKLYFRSSGNYEKSTSPDFWDHLKENMRIAQPAQLAISTASGLGHSVVADGYFDHNGYYHLNMGWLGKNNSWYDLAGSFYVSGYSIVNGAVLDISPSPAFLESTVFLDSTTCILRWQKSVRVKPEKYELQMRFSQTGPWTVLSNSLADTFKEVNFSQAGSYYFRVRAFQNQHWSNWSATQTVKIGKDIQITFRVKLLNRVLENGQELVLRGSIPPLTAYQNNFACAGPDSLGIFTCTVPFDREHIGERLKYRFAIVSSQTVTFESQNRVYTIGPENFQELPVAYFDRFTAVTNENRGQKTSASFCLKQNYPNPFNGSTRIVFDLPNRGSVSAVLFNPLGQAIYSFSLPSMSQGVHDLTLNFQEIGKNAPEHGMASGIYYLQIRFKGQRITKKLIYMP